MPLSLRWKEATTLAVDGDQLTPERVSSLSVAEASRLRVPVGNDSATVGDLFSIAQADGDALRFEGDLRHVRGIGRGMTAGTIVIQGDAGAYLGSGMTGGLIEVHGSSGIYAGAEMRGGRIDVRGDTGRYLGASLPGSRLGMRDGVILVHGSTAEGAGRLMRRGLIAVAGDVGDFFGDGIIAGSAFGFGRVGKYAGVGMKRGTVGLFGPDEVEIFPGFAPSGRHRFPFLSVYARRLAEWGFPIAPVVLSGVMGRYNGDLVEGGQGEILVSHE